MLFSFNFPQAPEAVFSSTINFLRGFKVQQSDGYRFAYWVIWSNSWGVSCPPRFTLWYVHTLRAFAPARNLNCSVRVGLSFFHWTVGAPTTGGRCIDCDSNLRFPRNNRSLLHSHCYFVAYVLNKRFCSLHRTPFTFGSTNALSTCYHPYYRSHHTHPQPSCSQCSAAFQPEGACGSRILPQPSRAAITTQAPTSPSGG